MTNDFSNCSGWYKPIDDLTFAEDSERFFDIEIQIASHKSIPLRITRFA